MPKEYIPYKNTSYFSSLICDYLEEKKPLQSLYNRFPKLENFKDQIIEKNKAFSADTRKQLVNVLNTQYKDLETSEGTQNNIDALLKENTFTITTGHQLNLFTGPLYFLYKIISVINLTKELKETYPEYNFVPIYWMATEDHDFDEINYFNLFGKKIQWNRKDGGAVGVFDRPGKAMKEEEQNTEFQVRVIERKKQDYLLHDNGIKRVYYSKDLKMIFSVDEKSNSIKFYDQDMKNVNRFIPKK